MRKTSQRNQAILDQAKNEYGIDLTNLRKICGLKFVLKLFKYVLKQTKKGIDSIKMLYPKVTKEELMGDKMDDYEQELKNAGFKISTWPEDFVDEDTGEVVTIHRYALKPLKKLKS